MGKTQAIVCFPDPIREDTMTELEGLGYKIEVSQDPDDGTMTYTVRW